MQLGLTQEGTFGCTRFFVAVLASPRKAQITALALPRRGRTAALAPPATALASSRREHANTAVKDEPQRWSRAEPRTKGRIAKEWQYLPIVHDLRDSDGKKGALMARYPRDVFPNGALQGILNTWGSISCQNQLISHAWRRYLAARGRFSRPGPLRGCTATKYCHNLPLRNALQLGPTQEGTFRCTRIHNGRFLPGFHQHLCI